jgi:GAF domain-containing protein
MARPDVAGALREAALAINALDTLDETLDAIVRTARQSLDGIDHVGISLTHHGGEIETKAATSQLVWAFDALQYQVGEGPCVHAIQHEPVVLVQHARSEQRWPRFIPKAVQLGLRSQLALQLYSEEGVLGGLNMYSTSSDTLQLSTIEMATLFASHAALALAQALHEDGLNTAFGSRRVIGQALGILMERYGIDEERAWAVLTRASSKSDMSLHDVATEVVERDAEGSCGEGAGTRTDTHPST